MVPGSVQDVQLMNLAADPVQFPVKVLDGGRVALLELSAQKPRHQARLTDPRRA